MIGIVIDLLVAAFIGWCTGKIMGYRKGTIANIIIGVIGGTICSILLGLFGAHPDELLSSMTISIIGACIFVYVYRLVAK